jgi:Flp pilus assembly secretin CpaC
LASIPLLGSLFKSREERKNQTELIVMVTPEVTKPMEPGEPVPMPPMPREFLGPVAPGYDKNSSAEPKGKPEKQASTSTAGKKAKGFFARKK